jgi:hypothetical protein
MWDQPPLLPRAFEATLAAERGSVARARGVKQTERCQTALGRGDTLLQPPEVFARNPDVCGATRANEVQPAAMNYGSISDLDTLVLRCRNKRARSYIAESVVCLKAGACRAAIVVAWIAVVHDLIEKFEELALGGDKNALVKTDEFRKLVETHNTAASLAFERSILQTAHKEFELFGSLALEDLERLQADRHRCAHPSMLDGDSDYQPPPELARYHVISAVTHLLEHGPAQGMAAIERLTGELEKDYFPDSVDKTAAHLLQGPLKHPRAALVRNFVTVLLKRYFGKDETNKLEGLEWLAAVGHRERWMNRAILVLRAMLKIHRERTHEALTTRLDQLLMHTPDDQRTWAVLFVSEIPELWPFVSEAQQNRLAACVVDADRYQIGSVMRRAWDLPGLRPAAEKRLGRLREAGGWSELAKQPGPVLLFNECPVTFVVSTRGPVSPHCPRGGLDR